MELFHLLLLLEQTVWIPIILCFIRFKDVKGRYLPLFIYLVNRAVLELTANLIVIYHVRKDNSLLYDLIYLSEALLVTWQLYNLGAFKKKKLLCICFQVCWVLLWPIDNFLIGSVDKFNLFFHTAYSFVLVFVATSLISKLAASTRQITYRNTAFWICVCFSIWFVYNIFYAFAKYLVPQISHDFGISPKVITFMEISEAIFYLIIAWAIYCIPPKRNLYPV